MNRLATWAIVLVSVASLGFAGWVFATTGFASVLTVTARLGFGGLLLYCLYSLGVFVLLGGAWLVAMPSAPARRLGRFTWARMLREAASDLLPFSQLGGIVVSTRMLVTSGMRGSGIYAALVVDLTTELAGQLVFTVFGIAAIASVLGNGRSDGVWTAVLCGTAALVAMVAFIVLAQRPMLALAGRMAQHLLPGSIAVTDAIGRELRAVYAMPRRVAASFALNLAAWVGSAAGAWVALSLASEAVPLRDVLVLECLIFLLRSAAFAIPGGIGVQEAGYALLAPHLGIPLEAALALALMKRVRDLAIGIPTLIVWQQGEIRALLTHNGSRSGKGTKTS